jgi:hypothetical protein
MTTTTIDLTVPTVHLNGTSKGRLLESLNSARESLEVAYQRVKETYPNGRDYYPQGETAIRRAEDQHLSRLARIDSVQKELDALIEAIDAQT